MSEIEEKEVEGERGVKVTFSMHPNDVELIQKLSKVLCDRGYIKMPRKSETVRYCCRAVATLLLKEIEEERLGQRAG